MEEISKYIYISYIYVVVSEHYLLDFSVFDTSKLLVSHKFLLSNLGSDNARGCALGCLRH